MDELTIAFKIESPPSWLPIGRTAENNWRTVEIDCSYWFNMNANGEVVLMYKPSCGMSPYPLLTEREGDNIIWRPKSGELVEGVGRLQAFFEVGTDVVGSSDMVSCEVDSSLLGVDPGTDPGRTDLPWALDIIEQIAELSGHYPKIIDGDLYIWDSTLNDWVEFESGGSGGGAVQSVNGQTGAVVLDASDVGALPNTYTAPVQSVNGQTGAVVLGASDVHALPDSTVIPPTVTEQTVSGWGFTKNTGTYSKPSGGIPKSDLASAVQTSIGKADTAVQPSAISGMATETYVQQQIAAIPDELPAVSASDNGKFLRVSNGAWAVKSDDGGSSVTVDDALSTTSTNPVQNKVVKAALDAKADASALAAKQDALTPGQNVTISGNTISANVDSAEIAANVTDWLDDNVTPVGSAVVVDSSLTIEGAAADAKIVGDVIAPLNLPIERTVTKFGQGSWTQAHEWNEMNNRVSPNPTIKINAGDTLIVEVGTNEKFAIAVWTVVNGVYTNTEFGSFSTDNLERTFSQSCEVNVVCAKTNNSNFTPEQLTTTIKVVTIPDGESIVDRVDTLWDEVFPQTEDVEVPFAEAYECAQVSKTANSYEKYDASNPNQLDGGVYNYQRARVKQDFIQKVPQNATSVAVTLSVSAWSGNKYKSGWAFYDADFRQMDGTIQGWATTQDVTFTASVPSNAVYFMVYYAINTSARITLTDIDHSKNSIVFNNGETDYAKTPFIRKGSADRLELTADPFIFSVNHRGYSTDAPENTLPAFILSRKKGFKYVEADVLFTSDEVPVILHDATINRTARNADGSEISATTRIDSITYAQALTYDFGIWKNSEYAGTKIPSFAEFMLLCKQLSLTPFIELKDLTTWTQARIDAVAEIISAVGMQDHVAFISFSSDALSKMSAHFPKAILGLGFEGTYNSANITTLAADAVNLKNGKNTICVSVRNSSMTSALFEILEDAGINSFVWTVNTESECLNLHRNVIGVLSDSLNAGQIIEDAIINA